MTKHMDENIVEIKMLGGFSIKRGNMVLTDDLRRTKQPWILLEYLIANRQTAISQEKLYELLWPDGDCESPSNALKNLIYRIRNLLEGLCHGGASDFIVFTRNNYAWNNEIPCTVDIEEFEQYFMEARMPGIPEDESIRFYRLATACYKGEFLPKSSSEDWVVFRNTHYARIYMECVQSLSTLLLKNGQHEETVALCEKAIGFEPFEEPVHEILIQAYLAAGYRQKAVDHYEYISNLFNEKLGVRLSGRFREHMEKIFETMSGTENDLAVISKDLNESTLSSSAYYCDYAVFRNLYRIEARFAERHNQSVLIALLTLSSSSPQPDPGRIVDAMSMLKDIILHSLRKGDVVSRFSNSQYLLMLPALRFENGPAVLNRIMEKFRKVYRHGDFSLSMKLNPLAPTA